MEMLGSSCCHFSLPDGVSITKSQPAVMGDVLLMVFAAGATAGPNCSLCQAGTYGTGSGQESVFESTGDVNRLRLAQMLPLHLFCFHHLFHSRSQHTSESWETWR